jgi:hypothetical protein
MGIGVVVCVVVALLLPLALVASALHFVRTFDPSARARSVLERRRAEVVTWDVSTTERLAVCRAEIRRLDEAIMALDTCD